MDDVTLTVLCLVDIAFTPMITLQNPRFREHPNKMLAVQIALEKWTFSKPPSP